MTKDNLPAAADAAPVVVTRPSLLMDPGRFEHAQRVAGMLASSPLFPDHLRKGDRTQAVANAVLVLDMADRMNENPLTVAQNIYFVGSKPGWLTAYMIARANQSGAFTDQIDWQVKGRPKENLAVTAFATLAKTGRKVQITCDMEMAKAEGWTKNAKYQSMPETMLRYRSATMLIRMYCPEVMIGMPAREEIELGAMKDVSPPGWEADTQEEEAHAPEDESQDIEDAQEVAIDGDEDGNAKHPEFDQFERLAQQIINDLTDGPADEVLDMYANNLEQMREVSEDLFNDVMAAAGKGKKAA